jgi:cellulase
VSCYQITVSGSGTLAPEGVNFPGAYDPSDPGLLFNMYSPVDKYLAPGPAVIPEGVEVEAGSGGGVVSASKGSSQPTATGASSRATSAADASTTIAAEPTPAKENVNSTITAATPSLAFVDRPPQASTAPSQGCNKAALPEKFTVQQLIVHLQN